jgi:hypothetical protein
LLGHPRCGSTQDASRDLAAVVVVDLDVGQAAAVVDHDVRERNADAGPGAVALLAGAVSVRPVSGLGKDW